MVLSAAASSSSEDEEMPPSSAEADIACRELRTNAGEAASTAAVVTRVHAAPGDPDVDPVCWRRAY